MVDVPPQEFSELVAEALDEVPERLTKLMDNVVVQVDDDAPPGDLYGLYVGVPLTARGNNYTGALPDRIVLYRQTICAFSPTPDDVRRRVTVTVVHEIAHHFGIEEHTLHELGWG